MRAHCAWPPPPSSPPLQDSAERALAGAVAAAAAAWKGDWVSGIDVQRGTRPSISRRRPAGMSWQPGAALIKITFGCSICRNCIVGEQRHAACHLRRSPRFSQKPTFIPATTPCTKTRSVPRPPLPFRCTSLACLVRRASLDILVPADVAIGSVVRRKAMVEAKLCPHIARTHVHARTSAHAASV